MSRSDPPELEFCGVLCPPEIFNCLESGDIDCATAVIALLIEAYTERSLGCVASPSFLGGKASISKQKAEKSIQKLIELGIVSRHPDGALATFWGGEQ